MINESVAARPTVLAFDDSGTNLSRLTAALQDEGYDVVVASSDRDVPDLLKARAVDCLVLPMNATALRHQLGTTHVPLLITLPSADDALVTQALDEGADDCAPVSGDLAVLKARLRAMLRRLDTIERKDKELVSLNYAISHDLRAPLRAIDGFGRILLEECAGTLDAKHLDYLHRIGAAARELGVLIDDLLQLSRAGRAELRKGRLDLSDMARRVAGDLQAASTRTVEVIVDDDLVVHADRTLMRVALEHLIGNSWKFTGPSPSARIECRAERYGNQAAFVVRDNGVGFDSTRAGKLFQPFQRLHDATEFEGAGIGLAVVQKIMDRHGGRVWAEGRPGQGASFYFTLPPGPGDSR